MVKLDQVTELLSKRRFARVAVEVHLSHPLVPTLISMSKVRESLIYGTFFKYEHIHSFCR